MAIRVEYRPNQTLMSMLQFFAGASERKAADDRAQAQRSGQQSGQYASAAMSGIQGAMKMNAQLKDRENRLAVEQERTWRRQVDTFQDEYGVTPGALVDQIPQTGAGMLQRPQQEADPMGGLAGPPPPPALDAQQQDVAPLSQTNPPEAAGPQFYAQGNMAAVPQLVKLKKKLDKYTTAADIVVSTSSRRLPDEEKAAKLSMLSPFIATMRKEYDALTKRYQPPKPITDYQGLVQAGFAIDMPGNDAVWYKTKDGYKPMTVHPKDSQGWMSEQDPELREQKKVQHFQDNYHRNEEGTEFLYDGKKWTRQKAEKGDDFGKEYDKAYMRYIDRIESQTVGEGDDAVPRKITSKDMVDAHASASQYIRAKMGGTSEDPGGGLSPAKQEAASILRSRDQNGFLSHDAKKRLAELREIIMSNMSPEELEVKY